MIVKKCATRIIIENVEKDSQLYKALVRALSVWDQVYHKYVMPIYYYDEDKKIFYVPGGYALDKLKNLFYESSIPFELIDVSEETRLKPRAMHKVNMTFPPRDDLQKAAIRFLSNKTEYAKNANQKLLSLKTGEGKTYCAINYCVSNRVVPMIFVDQEKLGNQWIEAIKQFTDCTDDNIYYISGQSSITSLLSKKKKDIKEYKFFVAIHRTVSNYMEKNFYQMNKLMEHLGIGVKIFDEAHVEIMSMFNIDEATDVNSIYLTATPSRSNPKENGMYKTAIREIKIFSTDKGIFKKEPYLNILLAMTNSNPKTNDTVKFNNKYGFNLNGYSAFMEKDKNYEFFISKITRLVDFANKSATRKIAIILHTLNMVSKVYDSLTNQYPDLIINRFDSTVKTDREEILNNSNIIITTDMTFNKGIDIKGLEVVINLVPVGSATKNEQMIGRLRELPGKEVWFFDVIDVGVPEMPGILNKKKGVYTKRAKRIKTITF